MEKNYDFKIEIENTRMLHLEITNKLSSLFNTLYYSYFTLHMAF